jgi:ABC-2 type transport system ATP-binding protein
MTSSPIPLIEVRDLAKTFQARKRKSAVRAVDGVSFALSPGETFGLLGPNGSGKTTTIRMLAGLLRPTAGTVLYGGRPSSDGGMELRAAIGLVTESGGIYENLTADEYLAFFGGLYGMPAGQVRPEADRWLDRFGLSDGRRRRIGTFSKGMKQKLHLVRALLPRPRLLLLDEPTSGLDPEMTENLWEVLAELRAKDGVATLLSTHNLDEAERLCDRVGVLSRGRLVRIADARGRAAGDERHGVVVTLRAPADDVIRSLAALPGVESVAPLGDGRLRIMTTSPPEAVNPLLARTIVTSGGELVALEIERQGLRDFYLKTIREG